ncbi:MAG: NUDIX hydrolase [Candidatus Pacearchaeota archaeon]
MKQKSISLVLFYDCKGNILIQDRRENSKFGEDYNLFGGKILEGETPDEAIIREVKEELGYNLKQFRLFNYVSKYVACLDTQLERFVFLALMPSLDEFKCVDGRAEIIRIEDSFDLKLIPGNEGLLREIYEHFKNG